MTITREEILEEMSEMASPVRKFDTGATRDTDQGKHDPEGFLSPLVIERFNEYMHKNRHQRDGNLRDSDNWQKGIPLPVYMKSLWRHFLDIWKEIRGIPSREGLEEACCGVMFNVMGILHETLKKKKKSFLEIMEERLERARDEL